MARSKLLLALLLASFFPLILQAQPLWQDWYLYNNNANLYVTEIGRGDTIVVLHGGWGAEHSYLLDAITGHEDEFHFILYDQRGSLRSPSPDSLISVDQHVADLEKLREIFGMDRMSIMAHSMGTFLAMAYLDHYPENIAGLVLVAAVPARMDELSIAPEAIEFMERPEVEEQIAKEGLDPNRIANSKEDSKLWKIRFAATNIYHIDRWKQLKGGRIFYSDNANRAASSTMPESWDFTSRLRNHRYPITVIIGDHDFADWKAVRWQSIAAHLPNLDLTILEKAGHNAWIDQPDEFSSALESALTAAARASSSHE